MFKSEISDTQISGFLFCTVSETILEEFFDRSVKSFGS